MMRRGVQRTRREGRKKTRYMVYNIGAGLEQYREYMYTGQKLPTDGDWMSIIYIKKPEMGA
eukprot:5564844-Pleurochrysis_carterae.AAC.1